MTLLGFVAYALLYVPRGSLLNSESVGGAHARAESRGDDRPCRLPQRLEIRVRGGERRPQGDRNICTILGGIFQVTLTNTSGVDVTGPSGVLTGLFFELGGNPRSDTGDGRAGGRLAWWSPAVAACSGWAVSGPTGKAHRDWVGPTEASARPSFGGLFGASDRFLGPNLSSPSNGSPAGKTRRSAGVTRSGNLLPAPCAGSSTLFTCTL